MSDMDPPKLLIFSGCDWPAYQEHLYMVFCSAFLHKGVLFLGLPVRIKRHPEFQKKHFAFWHIISEGEQEEDRTPDLRRCERIGWIRWVIENCQKHPGIFWWKNERHGRQHVVIWYRKENYVVVLAERAGYFLLKTAYLTEAYRSKQLQRELDVYTKKNKP